VPSPSLRLVGHRFCPMASNNILIWNVRGLNSGTHQDALCSLVDAERPSLVCIQETKLSQIDDYVISQLLGTGFDYFVLPADHTRGGTLVAWKVAVWAASSTYSCTYSVSIRMNNLTSSLQWWLTLVYGPSRDADRLAFLSELHDLRQLRSGPWLITGDFNMIYKAKYKSNGRLDRHRMSQFRHFINEASLKDIHLSGRPFTWSNERAHPTKLSSPGSVMSSSRRMIHNLYLQCARTIPPCSCRQIAATITKRGSTSAPSSRASQVFLRWSNAPGIAS
jgi:exonuclease III